MSEERKSNAGRHKKTCECPKCQAKRELTRPEETAEPVETFQPEPEPFQYDYQENTVPAELFSAYEIMDEPEAEPVKPAAPEPKPHLITGYLLLILVDTLIPLGLSFIAPKVLKREVTVRDLKMTKEERESLREMADAAAEQLNVNVPPLQMFIITCFMIYGSKLMK